MKIKLTVSLLLLIILITYPSQICEMQSPPPYQTGIASWYGPKYQGNRTANGETFDMHKLTAAHKQLPFGTVVKVTRLDTKQSVTVRINDRGPFIKGRIIDLSKASAEQIGLVEPGISKVSLVIIKWEN